MIELTTHTTGPATGLPLPGARARKRDSEEAASGDRLSATEETESSGGTGGTSDQGTKGDKKLPPTRRGDGKPQDDSERKEARGL